MPKKFDKPYPLNALDALIPHVRPKTDTWPYPIPENFEQVFDAALEHIPPRQAQIVRLRYHDRMTYDEIADMLNITRTNSSALQKASMYSLLHGEAFRLIRGGAWTDPDAMIYLPPRTYRILCRRDIKSLDHLAAMTRREVTALRDIGECAIPAIEAALAARGQSFMPEPEPEEYIRTFPLQAPTKDLTTRIANILARAEIYDLAELDGMREDELKRMRGVGKKVVEIIKSAMAERGYALT